MSHELPTNEHPHLNIPLAVLLQPELEPMGFWARTVHELLMDLNPQRLAELGRDNQLTPFLKQQQEQLKEEALQLEKEWKKANPLQEQQKADYQLRQGWLNQAKQSARETLISRLASSLSPSPTSE